MPINQQNGIHTSWRSAFVVPLDSVSTTRTILPAAADSSSAESDDECCGGMKEKLMRFDSWRRSYRTVPGIIDADPFLIPTKKYPASISAEEQNV